jgi:hypothetical protein
MFLNIILRFIEFSSLSQAVKSVAPFKWLPGSFKTKGCRKISFFFVLNLEKSNMRFTSTHIFVVFIIDKH